MLAYPELGNLSANRCSQLTYKELIAIAKLLYPKNKDILHNYILKGREELASLVYKVLSKGTL
jgi:hypothetical protein